MLTNYHTHTWRCHHASGSDREYVERAVCAGWKTMGFSDHSPYFFDRDHYSNYRMSIEQGMDYMRSIRSLAGEFSQDIRLLAGFEMEFYPATFNRTLRYLGELDCDYVILGQHNIGNEEGYTGCTGDRVIFDRYVGQVIDGMETGIFTYLCHPDLCQYLPDPRVQEAGFLRICEAAKRMNIPLELNMYGLADGRHYPCETFFRIAAGVGNVIVAGCDAHVPERIGDAKEAAAMRAFADRCGIRLTELNAEQVLARKGLIR